MQFSKAGHHALAQSITSKPKKLGAGFVLAFAAVLVALSLGLWKLYGCSVQFKNDLSARPTGQYQPTRLTR